MQTMSQPQQRRRENLLVLATALGILASIGGARRLWPVPVGDAAVLTDSRLVSPPDSLDTNKAFQLVSGFVRSRRGGSELDVGTLRPNATVREITNALIADYRQLKQDVLRLKADIDRKAALAVRRYRQAKGEVQDVMAGYYQDDRVASLVLVCLCNTLALCAAMGVVAVVGYRMKEPRFKALFAPRLAFGKKELKDSRNWSDTWKPPPRLGRRVHTWALVSVLVSDDDFLFSCGLDAFVLCRIALLGLRFCVLALLPAIPLLILYGTAHLYGWQDTDDAEADDNASFTTHIGVNRLSLSNVHEGSKLLWATVVAAYYLCIVACVLLWEEEQVFTAALRRYLYGLCKGHHKLREALRTVLVEDLPSELRSEAALTAQFEALLGLGCVSHVRMAKDEMPFEDFPMLPASPMASYRTGPSRLRHLPGYISVLFQGIKAAVKRSCGIGFQWLLQFRNCIRGLSPTLETPRSHEVRKWHDTSCGFVTLTQHAKHAQAIQMALADGLHVSQGPYPSDVVWKNMGVSCRLVAWRTAAVDALLAGGLLLWSVPVTGIQALASVRNLQLYLALPLQEDAWYYGMLTQYLPVLAWLGLLSVLRRLFWHIAENYERVKTYSEIQLRTMARYWTYTLCTMFITVLSGSVLDSLGNVLDNARGVVLFLGRSMSQVSVYFLSVVLSKAFLSPVATLRFRALLLWAWRRIREGQAGLGGDPSPWARWEEDLFVPINYSAQLPDLLLVLTVCLTYAPLAPLIIPAGVAYFGAVFVVYRFSALYLWRPRFQSQGSFFSFFLSQAVAVLPGAECALIAMLTLLRGYAQAAAILPLLGGTLAFRNWVLSQLEMHARLPLKVAQELDKEESLVEVWAGA